MSSYTDSIYEPVINHLRVRGAQPNQVLQANSTGQLVPVPVSALGVSMGSAGAAGDLSDVTITAPANQNILVYNSMSGQWENIPFPTLASLPDVSAVDTVTAPTTLAGHLPVTLGGVTYYIQLYTA